MSLWLEPAVFPVVLDSCVLYPYVLRNLLLEAASRHLYRVHWSAKILEDTLRHLLKDERIPQGRANYLRSLMEDAFPEAMVDPPAHWVQELNLNCHQGDRHVVAAALAAKAEIIVTLNIRHFPSEALAPLTIKAITPDQFLINLWDLQPLILTECLQTIVSQQKEPSRRTMDFVLESLHQQAEGFVSRVQELHWGTYFT